MGEGAFRFLVVEGNKGVGKSTCAEALRARLGATSHHYLPAFTRFRDDSGLDTEVGPQARLGFYLAATVQLSDTVRTELLQSHVVCDRYLAAPLSLLLAEGAIGDAEAARLVGAWVSLLLRPDLTLLVRSPHEVVCQRLRARRGEAPSSSEVERRTLESPEFFARREELLREHSRHLGPVVELDTTALSIEETGSAAWDLVQGALRA